MDEIIGEESTHLQTQLEDTKTFIRATNEHPEVPDDAEVFGGLNSYMAHMQV